MVTRATKWPDGRLAVRIGRKTRIFGQKSPVFRQFQRLGEFLLYTYRFPAFCANPL